MMGSVRMVLVVAGALALLSGCGSFDEALQRMVVGTPGCEPRHSKGRVFSVDGVNFNLNNQVVKGPVVIGKISYSGPEFQQLSEKVSEMDVRRQNLCAMVYSPGFKDFSEQYRIDVLDKLFAVNRSLDKVETSLGQGKSAKEVIATAAKEEQAVDERMQQPSPPAGPQDPTPPKVSTFPVDHSTRQALAELETRVKNLNADVSALKATGPVRLQVDGFDVNGVSLPAEKRQSLVASVRAAFERIPANRTPNVLVIGYADSKGVQNYNVAIALRRAEAVAQLLRLHDFGREFHTEVTSGGIYTRGTEEQARRVDLLVSRARAGAASA